jgi:hypothetical protein
MDTCTHAAANRAKYELLDLATEIKLTVTVLLPFLIFEIFITTGFEGTSNKTSTFREEKK